MVIMCRKEATKTAAKDEEKKYNQEFLLWQGGSLKMSHCGSTTSSQHNNDPQRLQLQRPLYFLMPPSSPAKGVYVVRYAAVTFPPF